MNAAAAVSARGCVVCGAPLAGRRAHARCCGGACRAEAARLRAILDGRPGFYRSISARLAARGGRTKSLLQSQIR